MSDSRGFRARIEPVPPATSRPLWSVMIPTYHCADYLAQTLSSVLEQDPGPELMQIEVIDDHSTRDDPEGVVREIGRGRVDFVRQPENVGHVRNFETCLARSRGHLIHILHGDDAVLDGFYRTMQQPFEAHPEVGAAFCRYIAMDSSGTWTHVSALEQPEAGVIGDWLRRIAEGQRLQTPTVVVRRSVYEQLGGFDQRLLYAEDWEMWVRIAAHFPVWYEPRPLAAYRIHAVSSSGRLAQTGSTFRDLRRAVQLNREHLPRDLVDEIASTALRAAAHAAIRRGHRMISHGEMRVPLVNMREAVLCSRAPSVLARLPLLAAHWLVAGAWSIVRGR